MSKLLREAALHWTLPRAPHSKPIPQINISMPSRITLLQATNRKQTGWKSAIILIPDRPENTLLNTIPLVVIVIGQRILTLVVRLWQLVLDCLLFHLNFMVTTQLQLQRL